MNIFGENLKYSNIHLVKKLISNPPMSNSIHIVKFGANLI